MKKFSLSLLLLFQFALLISGPVTKNELQSVVFSFIENRFPSNKQFTIQEISPVTSGDLTTLYIVNLNPEGWILISADDKVEPVLGFNFTGYFNPDFQEALPVNKWINQYNKNISTASSIHTLVKNRMWDATFETKSAPLANIDPLIEVTWDQDATFNRFCPVDATGPGGHAYVGCVAVSMAQALSVFDYPSSGTGTKSYYAEKYGTQVVRFDKEVFKWDSMSNLSADKYNARLLYCCAVSVSMNFGPDGSGSFTSRVPTALKTYFKYNSGVKRVLRSGTDSAWIQLLVGELKNGRPIIYSGDANDDEPGHAFNIDGVNSGKYFHLNWGWSGTYNGYFLITDLTPSVYDFTQNHEAVINIRPPVYCPTDIQLSKKTVKEGLPAGSFVAKVKIIDEAIDNTYTLSILGDSIEEDTYLPPDFYLSNDTIRTLKPYSLSEQSTYPVFIKAVDQYNNVLQKKFTISILLNSSVTGENVLNAESVKVYPNPSEGKFNIEIPEMSAFYIDLMDLSGRIVYQKHIDNLDGTLVPFMYNVPGIYILRITSTPGTSVFKKIIIQ